MLALLSSWCFGSFSTPVQASPSSLSSSVNEALVQATKASGVPIELLKALAYLEGQFSNHHGQPSVDGGYGSMHLIKNKHGDTLDEAAQDLGVVVDRLKKDLPTNIRGGAAVLHDEALQLSPTHTLPSTLADWYGVVAEYSHSGTRTAALQYADALYGVLETGFRVETESGEVVVLAPQHVTPNTGTAMTIHAVTTGTLPAGCKRDAAVDYSDAIDCILNPAIFDCTPAAAVYPGCTYESSNRPHDLPVRYVAIHDTEGSLQETLQVFQNRYSGVSIHYVIDTDGTVYELLHDKDVGYHVGNYWYNQRSIGIEHIGYDATGFLWYNAAQYLSSAKLTAYLLKKYQIPLDHEHIVGHGTVPSPHQTTNHVDPGPYWLWTYYFELIHRRGVEYPTGHAAEHVITLKPHSDERPLGGNGSETPDNFAFFFLHTGPSTATPLIPQLEPGDITDETSTIETNMSYYYLARCKDPAGTGDTMYAIWYGESDQFPASLQQTAHLAWLAVPPGAATAGLGVPVALVNFTGAGQGTISVYGRPLSGSDVIGTATTGAIFVSGQTSVEDGTTNLWYEINYNHRQAWVPASSIIVMPD
ncbi:amidase [Tengunoibacter tsumagoiensis]|uniref:N-acetylmuramoyl-L-alanine amidase n=1 Tax=Tengunoibacter tsumagoiensis TaxID=2014871 RepID=A0A401ZX92_9CHLR|nr:amidase [Tengunoibacter tsumagoiensis]